MTTQVVTEEARLAASRGAEACVNYSGPVFVESIVPFMNLIAAGARRVRVIWSDIPEKIQSGDDAEMSWNNALAMFAFGGNYAEVNASAHEVPDESISKAAWVVLLNPKE